MTLILSNPFDHKLRETQHLPVLEKLGEDDRKYATSFEPSGGFDGSSLLNELKQKTKREKEMFAKLRDQGIIPDGFA